MERTTLELLNEKIDGIADPWARDVLGTLLETALVQSEEIADLQQTLSEHMRRHEPQRSCE